MTSLMYIDGLKWELLITFTFFIVRVALNIHVHNFFSLACLKVRGCDCVVCS